MKRDIALADVVIPFVVPVSDYPDVAAVEALLPQLVAGNVVVHTSGYLGVASRLKVWGSVWPHPDDKKLLEAQVKAELMVMRTHDPKDAEERLRKAIAPQQPVTLTFKATGQRFHGTILTYKELHATG